MDLQTKIKVSELVQYLKKKTDQDNKLINLKVYGEISNFKVSYNNHIYFDLKDENSKISCIVFNKTKNKININLKDGLKVDVYGSVKVYPMNAAFQIVVENIEEDGLGKLFLEFEKNKKELEKLGYFEQKYKKEIPRFPQKVAIISGNNSAALKDTLTTLNKRYKLSQIYVFPTLVQGINAANNIIKLIKLVNLHDFDVILLVRGGGSFEDLNAFNDLNLAKTIFNSKTPIVTGIGHEIDYTIADFVCDYRAVTPTAAAIKISPNTVELLEYLNNSISNLNNIFSYKLNNYFQNIDTLCYRIEKLFNNNYEFNKKTLEYYLNKLESNSIIGTLDNYKRINLELHYKLINNYEFFLNKRLYLLKDIYNKLENALQKKIDLTKNEINESIIKLNLLDPNSVLNKGYSILKYKNEIIKDYSLLNKGDLIEVVNDKHKVIAYVDEVKKIGK